MTWPDITFALSIVSRYCNSPDSTDIAPITQILPYIKSILDDDIIFRGELDTDLHFIWYTDADTDQLKTIKNPPAVGYSVLKKDLFPEVQRDKR